MRTYLWFSVLTRLWMTVGIALGCTGESDEVGGAMMAAAVAAEYQMPGEFEGRHVRLANRWTIQLEDVDSLVPGEWLAGVQRVTGHPVVSFDDLDGQESQIAVLAFQRPPEESGDSLMVYMDWIGLTGGDDPGAWGRTTRYLFDCSPRPCRLTGVTFMGSWN